MRKTGQTILLKGNFITFQLSKNGTTHPTMLRHKPVFEHRDSEGGHHKNFSWRGDILLLAHFTNTSSKDNSDWLGPIWCVSPWVQTCIKRTKLANHSFSYLSFSFSISFSISLSRVCQFVRLIFAFVHIASNNELSPAFEKVLFFPY